MILQDIRSLIALESGSMKCGREFGFEGSGIHCLVLNQGSNNLGKKKIPLFAEESKEKLDNNLALNNLILNYLLAKVQVDSLKETQ